MIPTTTPIRKAASHILLSILLLLGGSASAFAQTYTISPSPFLTVFDNSGVIVSGGCVWTYNAGTTTPVTTFSDNVATPNTNPIIASTAGRFTAFLTVGQSYKFVYENIPCSSVSHGSVLRTADNISAMPSSSANVDIPGTAGEALTAGQAVYLSDGSGSKAAGQWFKADSANTYSSTAAIAVGMVPIAISSGVSGSIRITGQMTGLTSLSVGSTYYIGTAGAITATAPANARRLGVADTTSTLDLTLPAAPTNADNGINDFRLTLTTGLPVTTADVTAATTVYCTPAGRGNRIALYDSAGVATIITSAEFSIAVPATTSQMYDVFAYSNSGVATLELLAWTNDTTRATAIVLTTTGTYTKSGDLTRRYLGSFRTTTVSGQTEDSYAKRFVWNFYNRVVRAMRVLEATDTWTYQTDTYRQTNGSTANQLAVVVGVAEDGIEVSAVSFASNTSANIRRWTAIGEDSTTTPATGSTGMLSHGSDNAPVSSYYRMDASLRTIPAVGYHFYAWLERSTATGTCTWYGDDGAGLGGAKIQSGIHGLWRS